MRHLHILVHTAVIVNLFVSSANAQETQLSEASSIRLAALEERLQHAANTIDAQSDLSLNEFSNIGFTLASGTITTLGFSIDLNTKNVVEVIENTYASNVGIKVGDTIISINDNVITGADESQLNYALTQAKDSEALSLTVKRNGQLLALSGALQEIALPAFTLSFQTEKSPPPEVVKQRINTILTNDEWDKFYYVHLQRLPNCQSQQCRKTFNQYVAMAGQVTTRDEGLRRVLGLRLADMHYHGYGVAQNKDKALDMYIKHGAPYFAAKIYLEERGDIENGYKYLKYAAQEGHYEAMFEYGVAYLGGDWVTQDVKRADAWLSDAYRFAPHKLTKFANEIAISHPLVYQQLTALQSRLEKDAKFLTEMGYDFNSDVYANELNSFAVQDVLRQELVIYNEAFNYSNEEYHFYSLLNDLKSYEELKDKDIDKWQLVDSIETSLASLVASSPEKSAAYYVDLSKALHDASASIGHESFIYKTTKYAQKLAIESFGPSDIRTLDSTLILAKLHIKHGKPKTAKKVLYDGLSEFEANYAIPHELELKMHALLIRLYKTRNQHKQATKHLIAVSERRLWGDNPSPEPLYWELNHSVNGPGEVEVAFTIDAQGFVRNAKVVQSSDPSLSNDALHHVNQWLYSPKMKDGVTVASHNHRVTLTFDDAAFDDSRGTDNPLSSEMLKVLRR